MPAVEAAAPVCPSGAEADEPAVLAVPAVPTVPQTLPTVATVPAEPSVDAPRDELEAPPGLTGPAGMVPRVPIVSPVVDPGPPGAELLN